MKYRKATIEDIKSIHALLHKYQHQGDLIPRSLSELYGCVRDFSVAIEPGTNKIIACCALQFCWEDLAEVRSLVVETEHRQKKTASKLVEICLNEAVNFGMTKIFALTFKPDFFQKFGFTLIDRSELPIKIWADCMHCVKFPDCEGIAMMKALD
ncbi:Acetyltransferase, GNAT-family [Desulfonema limicola]|uniref:Acetyltransferase, GNAT-family n=1 Tax=Desulfonema limicola TaxID=45656 RepID=A0A975B734_9BACT|nr:N-acetyltransferase [Desulfonema limicola]QTA80050.1 Acetyltransferase, GNAT-family [Desulfonema limicola]